MSGLVIRVERIHEDPRSFRLQAAPGWWEEVRADFQEPQTPVRSPFALEIEGYRLGERLLFRGRIGGSVELECGRCAEPFEQSFSEPLELLLEPSQNAAAIPASGIELDPEDLALGSYAGEELDFGPLMLEILALAWPMQPRCTESCRGLCPQCGRNRNEEVCSCEGRGGHRPFSGLGQLLEYARQKESRAR